MENNSVLYGKPVNTKSLLSFIFAQMAKLNNNEIDANTACAQAKLASQACNLLNYELKRTLIEAKLKEAGEIPQEVRLFIRQIESKPFNNTIDKERL